MRKAATALLYIFITLMHPACTPKAGDPHSRRTCYRSFDRWRMQGIRSLSGENYRPPYVLVYDSGGSVVLDIRADSSRHWTETYQRRGDCFFSKNAYGDTAFYTYLYVFRDSVITYLYEGDTSAETDGEHYIVSIAVETPERKVLFHFYPFLHHIRPEPRNISSSIKQDWLEYMTITDYREEGQLLKADETGYYYASDTVIQNYSLYDLRRYPRFYMDHVAGEMKVR